MPGKSHSALSTLALILLLALALRIIFFHGIAPGDPFTYSAAAVDIVQGNWNPAYFYEQTTRWGLLFPLAVCYRLFGVNDFSSTLWPLITSLGTVAVAYSFALHLKGARAAVLAGIIVASSPLEIIYASQPMADSPLSFWLLLSLYGFVRAETTATSQSKRWFFFMSGIALALAYATKFVAILIVPFFLLLLLLRRRIEWGWAWLALGFLLIFVIEFLIFQQFTGNGLARLQLVLHDQVSNAPVTAGSFQVQNTVWLYVYWMLVDFHQVGLSFVILLLLLLHQVIRYLRYVDRERPEPLITVPVETAQVAHTPCATSWASWLTLLWGLTFLLVLSFYPTSIKPYVPLYKIEAYMLMFSAPLLVLTAVWLSEYAAKLQWTALGLILLSSLPFVYLLHESQGAHGDNARAVYAFYQAHRDRPIYAHRSDQRLLQYFDGFRHNADYKSFRLPQPEKDVHKSGPINFNHTYVAINQYFLDYHREDSYPPEILNPPAHWREVYRYQRAEHWLRRAVTKVADYLKNKGWIREDAEQSIRGKISNWSQTKPVVIYLVE